MTAQQLSLCALTIGGVSSQIYIQNNSDNICPLTGCIIQMLQDEEKQMGGKKSEKQKIKNKKNEEKEKKKQTNKNTITNSISIAL